MAYRHRHWVALFARHHLLGCLLGRVGLSWIGLDGIELDWIELGWIGLDWIELGWVGLGWVSAAKASSPRATITVGGSAGKLFQIARDTLRCCGSASCAASLSLTLQTLLAASYAWCLPYPL